MAITVDTITKRGFHYVATFDLPHDGSKPSLPWRGRLEFFNVTMRCFFAETLLDVATGETQFVIKVFWSDLPHVTRSAYKLQTGQTLFLTVPADKVALLRRHANALVLLDDQSDVLEFSRDYSLLKTG